jgi:2-amino-4-hydroxy-6-hydroxymethyldihydropteridine diphosphokinase
MPGYEQQGASQTSTEEHQIYLALGSNLGERQANLSAALQRLCECIEIQRVSSLYETEPVGYQDQPLFYNIACSGTTTLSAQELLNRAKTIEQEMGRQPNFRNGPRPIDIDILLFDHLITTQERLNIPHPRMRERAFVLAPLVEIAPEIIDPVTGLTIQVLAQRLSFEGVTKIETH